MAGSDGCEVALQTRRMSRHRERITRAFTSYDPDEFDSKLTAAAVPLNVVKTYRHDHVVSWLFRAVMTIRQNLI